MRILFDSRKEQFKTPFGTLRRGENCVVRIYVPDSSGAVNVGLVVENCDEQFHREVPLSLEGREGDYNVWRGEFSLEQGLYFYWFRVYKKENSFRLFKQGRGTNMEEGGKWQVTVIPEDFTVPEFAKGAVMYQILPDRFYKAGDCDLTEKLRPFTVHSNWFDTPRHTADGEGNWCNDFFGGNLAGIREKLSYLQDLGVDVLYLNPIFMSYSNHRYDTADYKRIDPMLGTEEDFKALCSDAHERGMKVILDGVFSHTGSNSVYFDAQGVFGNGAVSNPASPYRSWYRFSRYPDRYDAWWGMPTLPNVEETEPGYMDYIINDEDSVVAHWLKLGADGFRLDVVDELPDSFVYAFKKRMREINPQALLLGEVWEDASNKRAYGVSRRYFVDGELDSTMNYPWRAAIINFVMGFDDGSAFGEAVMTLAENYPPEVLQCVMNALGTHDTLRILTALSGCPSMSKDDKANYRLTEEERLRGTHRLGLAAFLQFTLPGMPSMFYGDEAGLEGFEDPFCRYTYPWGREDETLRTYYQALCHLKRELPALKLGTINILQAGQGKLAFERVYKGQKVRAYINRTDKRWFLPKNWAPIFGQDISFDGRLPALAPGGYGLLMESTMGIARHIINDAGKERK